MKSQAPFYIIDDEKPLLISLKNLVSKAFENAEIYTADESVEAWKKLEKEQMPVIIICDMIMPGLTGLQLLKKIKSHDVLKDSYFILMTASNKREDNIKSLKDGADDFLSKPFEIDQLIAKLRSASRVVNFQYENFENIDKIKKMEEELENEAAKQKELVKKIMHARLPELSKELQEIIESSIWIAKHLADSKEEVKAISEAAQIAHAGRALLPEKFLDKPVMVNGMVHQDEMLLIPEYFAEFSNNIRNFEEPAEILKHIYENFDGTGFPSKIKSWKIPLGSRILRVAMDYQEIKKKNQDNSAKAMELIFHEGKRLYDYRIVAFYDQFLASKNKGSKVGFSGKETPVEIKELGAGMMISRNIITDSGMILMSAGTVVNEDKIERIKTINKSDPIIGNIYIKER